MKSKTSGQLGTMSIKLDMSKAFDRIEWPFVYAALKAFGFPDYTIRLVRLCISSVSFSFLLNGRVTGTLIPQRGLRQGDPLSPYLFIICSDVFSCILQDLLCCQKIHRIKITKAAPCISHLFFTDDTLLFGHATVDEAKYLQYALQLYERASGQRINLDKSGIVFSPNTKPDIIHSITNLLGIPQVVSHDKYLGLPTVVGRNKKEVFSYIKDRIWKRISGWKEKNLSKAGKEILLKSVVQAIPTFAMSCFKLSGGFLKDIHALISSFWWGDNGTSRKIH